MAHAPAADVGAAFTPVAKVDDIPSGWVLRVRLGARSLAIANSDGAFYALDDSCSHAGGPLGDNRLREGCFVECPWHNSVFDVRTGEACRGPARAAQPTYAVRIEDGIVLVALD